MKEAKERKEALVNFQVNEALVAKAKRFLISSLLGFAHIGEVTPAVIEGPNSIVYDQAENRLHTQSDSSSVQKKHQTKTPYA